MKINVGVRIAASPADVWYGIQDVESHTEWMRDAVAIRFLGDQKQGAGTRFVCDTKIGPFSLSDVMEVTEWSPGSRMGIRHTGLVTGEGAFTLVKVEADNTHHTYFQWEEKLHFPWRLGGPLTAAVAWPVLRAMWKGNLLRLKSQIENS